MGILPGELFCMDEILDCPLSAQFSPLLTVIILFSIQGDSNPYASTLYIFSREHIGLIDPGVEVDTAPAQ
jgi:hypothetical protein